MNNQQNKWKQVWFENRFTQTSQRETKNVNTKVWFNWKKIAFSELPTSGTWYPPPQLVVRQKSAFIIYGIYRPVDIISICHDEYLDISAYQLIKSICIKSNSTCQQALDLIFQASEYENQRHKHGISYQYKLFEEETRYIFGSKLLGYLIVANNPENKSK